MRKQGTKHQWWPSVFFFFFSPHLSGLYRLGRPGGSFTWDHLSQSAWPGVEPGISWSPAKKAGGYKIKARLKWKIISMHVIIEGIELFSANLIHTWHLNTSIFADISVSRHRHLLLHQFVFGTTMMWQNLERKSIRFSEGSDREFFDKCSDFTGAIH